MYIETVPHRSSPPAILLRESTRVGKQVRKRTLANLTGWPAAKIQALRRVLAAERVSGTVPECCWQVSGAQSATGALFIASHAVRIGLTPRQSWPPPPPPPRHPACPPNPPGPSRPSRPPRLAPLPPSCPPLRLPTLLPDAIRPRCKQPHLLPSSNPPPRGSAPSNIIPQLHKKPHGPNPWPGQHLHPTPKSPHFGLELAHFCGISPPSNRRKTLDRA